MDELIGCRACDSPSCKGCNIKILKDMLNGGKFNSLMNKNRRIDCGLDVAPVVHGEWINRKKHILNEYKECSVCGNLTDDYIIRLLDNKSMDMTDLNYCPNCGAKMDGGAE